MASAPEIDYGNFAACSAIATNLARHSRGVDRNDFDLLCSAYLPDATVAYGVFEGPARVFAEDLTGAMVGAPTTLHRTSNMLIRVEGDRARSESYVIAYTRTSKGSGSTQRMIGGRYLDRHICRDGDWRIAHRTYVMDWNTNGPNNEAATMPGALRGAQGAADAAEAMFTAFRTETRKDDKTMTIRSTEDAFARQALHDLVVTYARGIDRADEALLASVFHADAEIVTGIIDGVAGNYARDIVAMVRTNLKSTFHSISNEYFEMAGDCASGESYVLAHMISAGADPQETMTGGRYLDRFEKRDGVWKIAHRTFITDWTSTRPVTMEDDGNYEALPTRGGYAPADPSMAFWAAPAAR